VASDTDAHARRLQAWLATTTIADRALTLDEAITRATTPLAASIAAPSQRPQPSKGRPALPAGLTAREAEVLRLVAEGLTDAQVAERLILSPRTVSTYLTAIYGKLQVNSRSAATRWAVENGLV
jgi:DNA-binding NarL/FixJ family response regulator